MVLEVALRHTYAARGSLVIVCTLYLTRWSRSRYLKPKKPGPNRIDAQREVSPDRPQEEKKKSGLLCVIRTHSWVGERERESPPNPTLGS